MGEMTYTEQMDQIRSEVLDSLLAQWHQWASRFSGVKGYNSRALVCGDFRVSRQYDDVSGALDAELDDTTMRTIDFQVSEMQDPHRTAIHFLAKNLTVGHAVFTSPRLPQDKAALLIVTAEARAMLTGRLISAGVV